ncbi:MAG TPA: hypothetical protein VK892_11100 [Pyrinomonadaceae bacterium]|nr:hypothetical protein [Pyrinomonadaceae bacterium]
MEILIFIAAALFVIAVVGFWFASHALKTAIREGKPNITINVGQTEKTSSIEQLTELAKAMLELSQSNLAQQIESKIKLPKSTEKDEID